MFSEAAGICYRDRPSNSIRQLPMKLFQHPSPVRRVQLSSKNWTWHLHHFCVFSIEKQTFSENIYFFVVLWLWYSTVPNRIPHHSL